MSSFLFFMAAAFLLFKFGVWIGGVLVQTGRLRETPALEIAFSATKSLLLFISILAVLFVLKDAFVTR